MLRTLNVGLITFELFLCGGGLIGFQVAFGHGLGDILYYIILYLLTFIHLIWIIKIWKTNHSNFIAPLIIFSITTLFISLKATIWRGAEYPWENGNIFFEKHGVDKAGTRMMYEVTDAGKTDYISVKDSEEKFVTEIKVTVDNQNKKYVFVDSGTAIAPDTLKHFMQNVDRKKILLEGENPFSSDSKLQTAYVKGQVSGVRNNQIVFYVSSWWKTKDGR